MTVKDLRNLINEVPPGMSPEEFDNLPVMVFDDGSFESANPETTGVMVMEPDPEFETFEGQSKNQVETLTVFCITNLEPEKLEDEDLD